MKGNWFQNQTWSEAIELEFLDNLKGFTPGEEQAPHLRAQGDIWLRSRDEATQRAGVKMLEKLLREYPDDVWEIPVAQDLLGHFYYQHADFDQAVPYLEAALRFYRQHKRVGVIRIADLLLAEIILLRRDSDRMEHALQLALDYSNTGGSSPIFASEKYDYAQLLAHLYHQLGQKEKAAEYAKEALVIAEDDDFFFGRSAALDKLYEQLPSLQAIAGLPK
jgi:uncharacterized protein HemY